MAQGALVRVRTEELVAPVGVGDDLLGERVAARLQQAPVEGEVLGEEAGLGRPRHDGHPGPAHGADGAAHLPAVAFERGEVALRQAGDGAREQEGLDGGADLVGVADLLGAEPRHVGPRLDDLVEHALLHQPPNGLAHRRAAHAAGGRQGGLGKLLPGLQLAARQQVRDEGVCLFVEIVLYVVLLAPMHADSIAESRGPMRGGRPGLRTGLRRGTCSARRRRACGTSRRRPLRT